MATVGGDILEITYSHPTLGSGTLLPKSGEDSTIDLGGFTTADDEAGITASGEAIYQMNNSRWTLETTVAGDMNVRKDLEAVAAMAASVTEAEFTVSMVNGAIYSGKGKPVGRYSQSINNATFSLKLQGGGGLKKI